MPRIRTIKPDFMDSGSVKALSRDARLFFVQLLTEVDDAGRFRYSPKRLAGVLYPGDEDVTGRDIDLWMGECERQGMVRRYTVSAELFACIPNFLKHQVISKPSKSRVPPPEDAEQCSDQESCNPPEPSAKTPEPSGKASEPSETVPAPLMDSPGLDLGKGTRKGNREKEKESGGAAEVSLPPNVMRLANLLADLIAANGVKRPNVTQTWAKPIDELLRLDDFVDADVEALIRWTQQHDFWHRNILSPRKLRHHRSTLQLNFKAESKKKPPAMRGLNTIGQMIIDEQHKETSNAT